MSRKVSKRRKQILEKVSPGKIYKISEAIELLKSLPLAKFKKSAESVDISFNLGVDSKKIRPGSTRFNGIAKWYW